ncbi:MAG: hypothetical protein ABSF60_14015 [Verrucomicrobiota bacterium]
MSEEFKKTGPSTAASENGFTVEVKIAGGVLYHDANGDFIISSEWLVERPKMGIILYKGALGNNGFEKMEATLIDSIFSNAMRALEYLGYRVEIWLSPSG